MEKTDRHINGEPIGLLKEKDLDENTIEQLASEHWITKLINGIGNMAKESLPLVQNIISRISSLIDMLSKIHFAAPFLFIAAAIYYQMMPFDVISLAWVSAISGLSVCLLCFILWFNEADLDYLYKQKWGVFWILASHSVVQILSFQHGFVGGHVVGGLAALASYPFYVYFNMKCEDDAEKVN